MEQSLMDKLTILADSAKYDVACTSSGASRAAGAGGAGRRLHVYHCSIDRCLRLTP